MNKNINLRKASLSDLELLLEMGYELFLIEKKFEPSMVFFKEKAKDRYIHQLKNPDALFLLLYVNEEIAGYCYAHLELIEHLDISQPECELEVIYLYPAFRKQGLSSLLLSEAIKWAKEKNAFRIKTDIFSANKVSILAFERQGFQANDVTYVLNISN